MATKTKATKKRPARTRVSKSKSKAVTVANHRFPPESEVGFWPTQQVTVERTTGRRPFPDPTATAKVATDGTLEVKGLGKGPWLAGAEVEGEFRFHQFSVKD